MRVAVAARRSSRVISITNMVSAVNKCKVLQSVDALDVLLCVATDASSQVDSTASLNVSDVQI